MAAVEDLMAAGMSATLAKIIGLEVPATALTATGTTQAGALVLTSTTSVFSTVGSGAGCICNSDHDSYIYNGGANALLVYPPGTSNINFLTASTALSVPANKGIFLMPTRSPSGTTGRTIMAIVSA